MTAATDGSATAAAIGLIAEPTMRSTGCPTGTEAVPGVTTIGGGVGVGEAGAAGVAGAAGAVGVGGAVGDAETAGAAGDEEAGGGV